MARQPGPPTFVVLNPAAGRSDRTYLRQVLEDGFARAGRTFELFESREPDEIMAAVADAVERGAGPCVAAGGDGTAAAVASVLVSANIPLGILPVGTGNALAVDLGIPLDPVAALQTVLDAQATVRIDAMRINQRHFFLNIGIGLSALAMQDTPSQSKRRFGRAAYIWAGFKKLLGFQPQAFALTIDGHSALVHASEITVANSGNIGGTPLHWPTQVCLSDGVIDIGVIRTRTLWDYVHVLYHLIMGGAERSTIEWFAARHQVHVHALSPLPVQGDGDAVGMTPVTIDIVPGAVDVIVPRSSPHLA